MEPTRNAIVSQASRRFFYNMTRRYGEQATLRKVETNSTDYTTGDRTRAYTDQIVRNAVYIPPLSQRNVTFTPSQMQAIRQYAWQGGAGQDIEETGFLVAIRDMRNWGEIDPTQRVLWRNKTYEVVRDQRFDGGVIIWTKVARNAA